MQPVLNVEDVRSVEKRLAEAGVSISELMHRAGAAVAQEVKNFENLTNVCVLAGFGNNGGDGWVAAEELHTAGISVRVVSPCEPADLRGDLAHMVAKSAIGAGVSYIVGPSRTELDELLMDCDVVVDAMLGIGLRDVPQAPFNIWIDAVNASGCRVIAVDVPSGLSAQTGRALGPVVAADSTITMIALKPGLLADDGRDTCGSIVVAQLAEQTTQFVYEADPVAWRCDSEDYLDVLAPATVSVDKFERGNVLVVGGSAQFPGAAIMAARSAARAGAGYVTLAVPEPIAPICRTHLLEIPVVGLPAEADGTFSKTACDKLVELASKRSAVLVGPGMRVTGGTAGVVSALLGCDAPLVIDADGLNCLAQLTSGHLDKFPEILRRTKPLILTPHRRELGRLVGAADNACNSLTACLEAARRIVWADGGNELCVVAKGTATACVGVEIALLPKPGPVALATAGTGDVLAGIMLTQLSRSTSVRSLPTLAALACEIHAQAGILAQERFGTKGAMAADIIEEIGLATDIVENRVAYAAAGVYEELDETIADENTVAEG